MKHALTIIAILVLSIAPAHAGTTQINLGLTGQTGVLSAESATATINYEAGEFSAGARFGYLELDDDNVTMENYQAYAGYDQRMSQLVGFWSFAEAQRIHSDALRAELRAGAGGKVYLVDKLNWKASVSAGPLLHMTDYAGVDDDNPQGRASGRVKVGYTAGGPLTVKAVGFYQPAFDHPKKDYDLIGLLSARYAITETFGLLGELEDTYRSASPHDENHSIMYGLSASWEF